MCDKQQLATCIECTLENLYMVNVIQIQSQHKKTVIYLLSVSSACVRTSRAYYLVYYIIFHWWVTRVTRATTATVYKHNILTVYWICMIIPTTILSIQSHRYINSSPVCTILLHYSNNAYRNMPEMQGI